MQLNVRLPNQLLFHGLFIMIGNSNQEKYMNRVDIWKNIRKVTLIKLFKNEAIL